MAIYAADFSDHQGKIDAKKFKNDILFGIIRVQAGYTYEDSMHKNYEEQFIENHIPFAEYAYGKYVSVPDAIAEAKAFLNRVTKKVNKSQLKLAIDIEVNDCKSNEELVLATQAFINTVKSAGYDCGIYSGEYFFNSKGLEKVKADFRWIASYALKDNGTPQFRPTIPFDLWQFSSKGRLSGVPENTIDLDLPATHSIVDYFVGKLDSGSNVSNKSSWVVNYISANELNVRSGRGENFGVVLTLPKNSKILYLVGSTQSGWGYISYENLKKETFHGYVNIQYLSDKPVISTEPKPKSKPEPKKEPVKVESKPVQKKEEPKAEKSSWEDFKVTATELNLRSGQGEKYSPILVLPKGSKIKYLSGSSKDGWGLVSYTNSRGQRFTGYVLMTYVTRDDGSSATSYHPVEETKKYHTVVAGDSLTKIAQDNHLTISELAKLNGFSNINRTIYPGTKIRIK